MANSSGSEKIVRRIILFCILVYSLVSGAAHAATLTGSLASGQLAYYDITLPVPQSGMRLVLSSSASSDFLLYTGTNHTAGTQIAASYGQTLHTLLVAADDPNLVDGGQYHVRIKANASLSYSYTADLSYLRTLSWDNGTTLAGVNVINQPDSAGGDYLFRITGQSPVHPGWRNVLKVTAGEADLYLQQNTPPLGGGSYSSTAVGSDAIYVTADSSLSGQTWYIRVHATPGATWQLGSGDLYVQDLAWDNGSAPGGSSNISQPSSAAGEYFFSITSQAPTTGAWRTVLNVLGGEANFYLQQDSIPFGDTSYKSTVTGSDGLILAANQYGVNQTWYIRVHANSSSTWNIFSGEIYARDIGTVGDTSSIAAATIGPEGTYYYRTSVDATTKAWRLWLNGGGQTIWVRQSSAPVKTAWTEQAEQFEAGQMLLVPPYLTNAVYFIGVTGTPGSSITLDSRRQAVTTLNFNGSAGTNITGYGYTTYRVDVPIDQIAWQINLTPGAAGQNPELYIRSGDIPNRWTNSALSEAPAGVIDSITQVPPTLTDGTWYITVYGSGSFSYTLANIIPVVTGKPFINTSDPNPVPPGYAYPYNTTPIINDDLNRSGWRYYQVSDINSQLGFLGWQLDLDAAHQAGREIALRRNAVPSRWLFRNGNSAYSTSVSESYHVDASSNYGFLQHPGHQADIWYIGINTPNQAMGAFQLTTREIPAPLKQVNSSSSSVSGQIANTWQWFKFTVPSSSDPNNAKYEPNFLGWDLRLKASSGNPRMVIRRDQLPADFNTNTGYYTYGLERLSNWQTGLQWAPGIGDMYSNEGYGLGGPTRRYSGDKNSYLIAGMGSPLEAGSYYVGVSGDGSDTAPLSYTLESRGIGIGNDASSVPWPIQVQDLGNFTGGSVSKTGLAPREAVYYRITVPAAQKSWSVKLEPTLGEALMTVRQGALPNMTASNQPSDSIYYFNGNRRQKAGREFFYKYAESPQTAITAGTYYIAVFSEGQNPPDDFTIGSGGVNFTLTSYGLMPVADKTSTPAAVGTPVTWNGETLQYGQQKVYRFRAPAGLTSMEIRLKNRVGNPTMALRQDAAGSGMIPGPGGLTYSAHEGGYTAQWSNDTLITVPQPAAGDYTLLVAAAPLNSGPPSYTTSYPDATYDVEVTVQGLVALPFTNGNIPVSGQEANTWRFFQVSVPSGALGWDLRLKPSSGNPRMVIRRDQLPTDFYSATGYYTYGLERLSNWQTGLQWAPGIGDMYSNEGYGLGGPTRRYSGDKNSYLIAGMGSPLEAGSYYVGVSGDGSDTAPLSYTLESRGIGIGNDASSVPWPIQVQDLGNFTGGSVSKTGLAPREAVYYRITVPAAQKSWSVKLEPTLGEALMTVRQGALPNMTASNQPSDSIYYFNGNRRQKAGREFFYKYAESPQTAITAGTYYIAVFSEGQNPPDDFTIGSGGVNFTLTSYGLMPVADKTSTPAAVGTPVTWNGETLQYGQQKVYRFRVPAGLTSMEIRLKNRVGNPTMALRQDAAGSGMIPGPGGLTYSAHEGGYTAQWSNDTLITVPQPVAGDYTLVVGNKRSCLPNWPYTCSDTDNSYDVEVTALTPTTLILDNGSASGSLVDQQIRYYQVNIPATINGYPLAGWKIGTSATNGSAKLYIAKNGIPNAPNQPTLEVTSPFAVLTAPYLEPGTWYIAVQGVGITDYSITSEIISASPDRNSRSWSMPPVNGSFTQPGLAAPWFGDSGIDDSGNPIINPSTGDQGTDLGENDWHFYRIAIPAGNGGILKTVVEALSGKPELYIRKGGVPSPYHRSDANDPNYYNSYAPYAYDRLQSLNGTMYGNWVPLDRRSELQLAPGEWWLGIKAVNSNIRYRLRVAAGNVRDAVGPLDSSGYFQDLNLVSGGKTGQTLAAGDMRYYRLTIPQSSTTQSASTPTAWNLTLNQQVGDVAVLIRDTIPPGMGTDGNQTNPSYFMDWGDDNSYLNPNPYVVIETPGTTTIPTPPLRPGATYYLGVYAITDATFDISSGIGTEKLKLDGVIPFANGTVSTTLAAGEQRLYRIDVPSDALVWHHNAQHDGGIRLYLAQGTVPPKDSYAHWYTYGNADTYLNQNLTGYPWQAGYSYYLLVENTTGAALPFSFNMSGKSVLSRLTLSITATCPGSSVTTSPDLFTCTSGSCNVDVMPYSGISLYANPGNGCAPTAWTGACLSFGNGYGCTLPMDQSATTSIGFVDTGAPSITFSIPDSSTTSNVAVSLTASDNVAVTGYCLNETGNSGTCVWSSLPPATYTFSGLTDNTPTGRGLYAFSRDAAGNISTSYDYIIITVTEATLSVTLAGSGSGSVNSNPTGLTCTSGTCSRNFALNSTVGLFVTPSSDSTFVGWSGACGGSGACSVSMSSAKAVTATFNLLPPVRLNRATPLYYSTPQDAYNAAVSGDVIQLKEGTLAGSLNMNRAIAVSLKGGYNASYSAVSSSTLLQGTVTLGLGSAVLDRVNIR